jgi:hypothetical protein
LLLLADSFRLSSPPDAVVASLFYLIPLIAILVCFSMVWFSSVAVTRKLRWMLFTLTAMLLQFGAALAIFVVATG